MPKRSRFASSKRRSAGPPPSKRAKSDVDTTTNPTSFLDLPGELRNDIDEYALLDLLKTPPQPYTLFKTNMRTYVALLQSNKQARSKLEGVFRTKIAPDFTFFTDNNASVYDVRAAIKDHPPRATCRFSAWIDFGYCPSHSAPGSRRINVTRFIALQQAWSEDEQGCRLYGPNNPWGHPAYLGRMSRLPPKPWFGTRDEVNYRRQRPVQRRAPFGKCLDLTIYVKAGLTRWLGHEYGPGEGRVVSGKIVDLVMDTAANIESMRH